MEALTTAAVDPTPAEAFGPLLQSWQARMEQALAARLPAAELIPERLHAAMRYVVLGGGKRVRPALLFATALTLGLDEEEVEGAACAIELIHAYSLVHDDLPAMDDDDLRRGRPTCHRAFDEGTAILAGDALQSLAFDVLARSADTELDPGQRVLMLATLAHAIGTEGMAGGQAIDLAAIGQPLSAEGLERMHRRKTGALIQASVELGAIAAGLGPDPALTALRVFGAEIGLAFQIQDDILDVTGETSVIGKQQGADAALGKPTYPSIFGLPDARMLALQHLDAAIEAIKDLGRAHRLREFAVQVVNRAH